MGTPEHPPRNALGTAALVLGVFAILSAVLLVGGALGVVGLAFGVGGLVRVRRGHATNLRAAAAGAVLSGIAVLATIGLIVQSAAFVSSHRAEISIYDACVKRARTPADRKVCTQQLNASLTHH